MAFDRYHTPQDANAALVAFNKANPARTAIHRVATSPGGIELLVLEIGPEVGKKARRFPAVLVLANMEGVLPLDRGGAPLATLLADADAAK